MGEVIALHRHPLTPTPLPPSAQADIRRLGERGYSHEPISSVLSPLKGEGQGEGEPQTRYSIFWEES
jgi:hypothetical protein